MFTEGQKEAIGGMSDFLFEKSRDHGAEGMLVIFVGDKSTYRCLRNFSALDVMMTIESLMEIAHRKLPHKMVRDIVNALMKELDKTMSDELTIEKAVNAATIIMEILERRKEEADGEV